LAGQSQGGSGVGALSAEAVQESRAAAARGSVGFSIDGALFDGRLVAEAVHAVTADVVGRFESGLQAGSPAVTRNRFGAGEAWYVATQPSGAGIDTVMSAVVAASGVRPIVTELPSGVEVARRGDLVTVINHGEATVDVDLEGTDAETGAPVERVRLESQGVAFVLSPVPAAASAPAAAAFAV
jgi:beta-galactosidase